MSMVIVPDTATADRALSIPRRRRSFGAAIAAASVAVLAIAGTAGAVDASGGEDCDYSGPPGWLAAVSTANDDAQAPEFSTGGDRPTWTDTALTGASQAHPDPAAACY